MWKTHGKGKKKEKRETIPLPIERNTANAEERQQEAANCHSSNNAYPCELASHHNLKSPSLGDTLASSSSPS